MGITIWNATGRSGRVVVPNDGCTVHISARQSNVISMQTSNSIEDVTIQKNKILNWLYSTDRHVSIEKLGSWLENNTGGQYKLVRNNILVTMLLIN